MNVLEQIISAYRHKIPKNCATARAIDRGANVEDICAIATSDGLHEFASALFAADVEVVHKGDASIIADETLLDDIRRILSGYEHRLPPDCETARLIKSGAELELISQSAQAEGLQELTALLFEAEQEQLNVDGKPISSSTAEVARMRP